MSNPSTLTLSQLQGTIKHSLAERFPLGVWVSGEIDQIKVNYSGHCYLELIEKGERDTVAKAQCRAVIWRTTYATLSSYFSQQTGTPLTKGIKVLVKAQVTYHELYGLSLQITDIDPQYSVGDAQRERQKCIAQLHSDGVWDINRELPLPHLIQRLAVVSSANAAGYQDFMQEIGSSPYHFDITLYDAFMQGAGAQESMVAALDAVAINLEEYDAVVIIRGGGSSNDLRCFDGYRIASHVAQFPIPIFTGIGHDKDVSVVDMVASQGLKTPTAVATMLVERCSQLDGWLDSIAIKIHDLSQQITHSYSLMLESLHTEIIARSEQLLNTQSSLLQGVEESLPQLCSNFLELQRTRLEGMASSVELHSPHHLLQLGYAVARMRDVALRSVEGVKCADKIDISLSDGQIVAQVVEIKKS